MPRRRNAADDGADAAVADPTLVAAVPVQPAVAASAAEADGEGEDLCTLAELQGVDPSLPSVVLASVGLESLSRRSELARLLGRDNPAQGIEPGVVLQYDGRTKSNGNGQTSGNQQQHRMEDAGDAPQRPLRLVQWNIERCYKMSSILSLLRAQDADVVALQEVDIGCARSEWGDHMRTIAQALGMNCHFVAEFRELYSPLRPPEAQGGGVHGNAILSRFEHRAVRVVAHAASYPWETHGHHKREPRLGGRYSLALDVGLPGGAPPLRVYSVHMEVFAGGPLARLVCLAELFEAARDDYQAAQRAKARGDAAAAAAGASELSSAAHQAILGDFNTLSHGIARFSSSYCTDALRWGSLGYTEAEWLTRFVLHRAEGDAEGAHQAEAFLRRFVTTAPPKANNNASTSSVAVARPFTPAVIAALANPGFVCPFDAYDCATLSNYRGWFQGKLDWMLLRNITVVPHSAQTGNDDYTASDHKLLRCDVTLDAPVEQGAAGQGIVRYASKSSRDLARLMPLRRPRPGVITSSATRALIYLPQIAAFWLVVLLAGWTVMRSVS